MDLEIVLFLQAVFLGYIFIGLVIYKYTCNALNDDCQSSDKKMREQQQLIIMECVMKTTVKNC